MRGSVVAAKEHKEPKGARRRRVGAAEPFGLFFGFFVLFRGSPPAFFAPISTPATTTAATMMALGHGHARITASAPGQIRWK